MGIAKAAVFPLPVSAHPKRSRFESATGMAWAWMGVGLVYEWNVMSFMMSLFNPCARLPDSQYIGGKTYQEHGTKDYLSLMLKNNT